MQHLSKFTLPLIGMLLLIFNTIQAQEIPLAEHPRPDFERKTWLNLNGTWAFKFDPSDEGIDKEWYKGTSGFDKEITVPFPWGSKLSGVEDEADVAWYYKPIMINPNWPKDKRTFLTIGAADWQTDVWLDGQHLGRHEGGYVPFSFEITELIKANQAQHLIIRVDDKRRNHTLYGKQGYGNARGIWQTIYLEARGQYHLDALHFTPDIDQNKVDITAYLAQAADQELDLSLAIAGLDNPIQEEVKVPAGKTKVQFSVNIPDARLWSLDDPFLYEVQAKLEDDEVHSYFGMRKISVEKLPGTDFPYIALNNQPVYLQLALDQSYHPDGFYTFPSDQFMKEEILRSKSIGLNGIRPHIKVEIPRKLYWADKLGLLVMQDLPNSWGEPDELMQAESEYTLRQMIKRDYNHPSIFSWVIFNETWGLWSQVGTDDQGKAQRAYTPATQNWVASMYYLAKSLDQSRLVEDNSICCGRGHTETDINSWHIYLPGYEWDSYLSELNEQTYAGSTHHFEEGFTQGNQPNINSECGNVWGYDGSAGDVDWSWDYHRMINTFRMYPKVAGWLYTEHHDVINEWNGYWRFDRSEKFTGMEDIVEGMVLNDLHSPIYLSTGNEICKTVNGGSEVEVPLFLSSMTDQAIGNQVDITYELVTTNYIGETEKNLSQSITINYEPWMQKALTPIKLKVPDIKGLAVLKLWVKDQDGKILHRNFMHFVINSDQSIPKTVHLSTPANQFQNAKWSKKQWEVLDGKKVNGAGKGFFEYSFPIDQKTKLAGLADSYFIIEASAKELFVKDIEEFDRNKDYMKGSKAAPSANPNAYPMTDESKYPSTIQISVNGQVQQKVDLADDPADHRGVLSWHNQKQNRQLREAGSYGYLIKVPISKKQLQAAKKKGSIRIRLASQDSGGLAIYGQSFGRYAFDPSIVLKYK